MKEFNEIEKTLIPKEHELFKCEMCGEITDTAKRQLDDLIVCEYCFDDSIETDSWGIRPENFRED